MAEVLGLAASIAGLLSLAEIIASKGCRFVKKVGGAEKEIKTLVTEVTTLYGVLSSVNLLITRLDEDGTGAQSTSRPYKIHSIHVTLENIKSILDKCAENTVDGKMKSMAAVKKRLNWPSISSDILRLLEEVREHKSTLNLALTSDVMSTLIESLAKQEEIAEELRTEVRRKRKEETMRTLNKERQKILQALGPVDPYRSHQAVRSLRQEGTGLWFLESKEFRDWLATRDARLWLYGIPGAGKTVLMSLIIDEAEKFEDDDNFLGYFYCTYKDNETQNPKTILGALIRQLAINNTEAFDLLESFYRKHHSNDLSRFEADVDTIRKLFLDILKCFDTVMVIVDGLDECQSYEDVVDLLASIAEEAGNVKTLFASRREIEIQNRLSDYVQVSIAARSSDLKLYVNAEVELRMRKKQLRIRDPALKEHIIDRLVEKADGMFHWVKCQIDSLCIAPHDRAKREALDSLPPTLPATYERILDRVNKAGPVVVELVQKVLRWIECSAINCGRILQMSELVVALSVKEGDTHIDQDSIPEEEDILKWCSSLVRKRTTGELEFSHYSVQEFLCSIKSGEYLPYSLYSRVSIETELSKVCLSYIGFEEFSGYFSETEEFDERQTRHPFYDYAIEGWFQLAERSLDDINLCNQIYTFFKTSRNSNFLRWSQELIIKCAMDPTFDDYGREWRHILTDMVADTHVVTGELLKTSVAILDDATTLNFACTLGLYPVAQRLATETSIINKCSETFGTPLICAAQGYRVLEYLDENYLQTVVALLDAGAQLDIEHLIRGHWNTPLELAVWYGAIRIIELLLNSGATVKPSIAKSLNHLLGLSASYETIVLEVLEKAQNTQLIFEYLKLHRESAEEQTPWLRDSSSLGELLRAALKQPSPINEFIGKLPDYTTALREAAALGQLEIVIESLDNGADIDCSALHLASRNQHLEVVRYLVERGAHLTAADDDGYEPLHRACEALGSSVVEYLVHCHLSKGISLSRRATRTKQRETPSLIAVRSQSLAALKVILENDKETTSELKNESGWNCLHLAISHFKNTDTEMVELLLQHGFNVNGEGVNKTTPLHLACRYSHSKAIRLLLEHGANVELQDKKGQTCLHFTFIPNERDPYALQWLPILPMDDATIILILERASNRSQFVNTRDKEGLTAMHVFLSHYVNPNQAPNTNFDSLFNLLVRNGADLTLKDSKNRTPLVLASVRGFCESVTVFLSEVPEGRLLELFGNESDPLGIAIKNRDSKTIQLLLGRSEVDVDRRYTDGAQDPNIYSPLQMACMHGLGKNQSLYSRILSLSKNLSVKTVDGLSLLHLACANRVYQMVSELLEIGWDIEERALNDIAPIFFAARPQFRKVLSIEDTEATLEVMKTLVDNGADTKAKDSKGWGLAHYLCGAWDAEQALRWLLEKEIDFDITARDKFGWTALHFAAASGNDACIRVLLTRKIFSDIDLRTSDMNRTPLYLAAQGGYMSTSRLLLGGGADVNAIESLYGDTPLHAAAAKGSKPLVELLLENGANIRNKTSPGLSPEHVAYQYGHNELAEHIRRRTDAQGTHSTPELALETTSSPALYVVLRQSVLTNNLSLCRRLVQEGADVNGTEAEAVFNQESGQDIPCSCTLLLLAIQDNFYEIAEFLVSSGAELHHKSCPKEEYRNCTAGQPATCKGHQGILKSILDRSTDIDLAELIPLAVWSGNIESVELLLTRLMAESNDNVNKRDLLTSIRDPRDQLSVLHIAIETKDEKMLTFLLRQGVSPNLFDGGCKRRTPLHLAVKRDEPAMVKLLVEYGAWLELADDEMYTSVCYVCSRAVLEYLCERGARLDTRSCFGQTLLGGIGSNRLSSTPDYDLLQCLADHGLDFNAKDQLGYSVLHAWLDNHYTSSEEVQFLLNNGADPETLTPYGTSTLQLVCTVGQKDAAAIIKVLLSKLPPETIRRYANARSKIDAPLYSAAFRGRNDIVEVLLELGAELDALGGERGGALHAAATNGRIETVKLLLAKGAKLKLTDDEGGVYCAIEAAKHNRLDGIVELLQKEIEGGPVGQNT